MNEATITRQVMVNWARQHEPCLWHWKIPDYMRPGQMYSNNRAVDVVACYRGVMIGIEWKIHKSELGFRLDHVREGQIETLREIEKAGGVGFLAIAIYKSKTDKYLYLIPVEAWMRMVDNITDGRKSIRLVDAFPGYRVDLKRSGSYVHWNMNPIEEAVHAVATSR